MVLTIMLESSLSDKFVFAQVADVALRNYKVQVVANLKIYYIREPVNCYQICNITRLYPLLLKCIYVIRIKNLSQEVYNLMFGNSETVLRQKSLS